MSTQLAGCVLAARLTENPGVSVAVLEAGKAHLNDPLVSECSSTVMSEACECG